MDQRRPRHKLRQWIDTASSLDGTGKLRRPGAGSTCAAEFPEQMAALIAGSEKFGPLDAGSNGGVKK